MRTQVIRNLFEAFPELGDTPHDHIQIMQEKEDMFAERDVVSLGAEVEVRWKHYFPNLHNKFMSWRPYSELSPVEQEMLTNECKGLEKSLIPRLKLTEYCGIPKGKDRYYEFAFQPCFNPAILAYEIQLLKMLKLIPKNHKHSLHITLGGLGASRKAGFVLMALEVIGFTSPERIVEAANPTKAMSWGRKGRAGLRERLPDDVAPLTLGKPIGVELRTLELPIEELPTAALFGMASFLGQCATSTEPEMVKLWDDICWELFDLAKEHHLDIKTNWGRTYENPDMWFCLAKALPNMDKTRLAELINKIPKLLKLS